jgi:hypothetical protein
MIVSLSPIAAPSSTMRGSWPRGGDAEQLGI